LAALFSGRRDAPVRRSRTRSAGARTSAPVVEAEVLFLLVVDVSRAPLTRSAKSTTYFRNSRPRGRTARGMSPPGAPSAGVARGRTAHSSARHGRTESAAQLQDWALSSQCRATARAREGQSVLHRASRAREAAEEHQPKARRHSDEATRIGTIERKTVASDALNLPEAAPLARCCIRRCSPPGADDGDGSCAVGPPCAFQRLGAERRFADPQ
jgi:hypothetical protein